MRVPAWRASIGITVALSMVGGGSLVAQATRGLEVKWVRDSETYATLTRQIYRLALEVVRLRVANRPGIGPWAVVLDVDETTLDNSAYQLELGPYETDYDDVSWNAWVARRTAPAVPGVRRAQRDGTNCFSEEISGF